MSPRIAVLGGGIAGLATAHRLAQRGAAVTLFEARGAPGGNIETREHDGCLLEQGPDALLAQPGPALALCDELGLTGELTAPGAHAARVLLAFRRALVPMPEGLAMGLPREPMQLARTPLLSPWGKLRALGDLVLPARRGAGPVSVEQLVAGRFGREVCDRLVAPLLGGIYGGSVAQLDAAAVLPQLASARGSILRTLARAPRREGPGVRAPRGGLSTLVRSLARGLGAERLRTDTRATALGAESDGAAWVRFDDGSRWQGDAVVLAMPPHEAAAVVRATTPDAAARLDTFRSHSSATVTLAYDAREFTAPRVSGVLVAPSEQRDLLAVTFVGRKWPGRVRRELTVLRAVVGGPRAQPLLESDGDAVRRTVEAELRCYFPLPEPRWGLVTRHRLASPQPEVGHFDRVAAAREALRTSGPFELVGAAYDGPGIAGCVRGAEATAARLLASAAA